MKVLGLSYGYHDASACLVIDGRVAAASAEERFTRQKHDANFPAYSVEFCLAQAGITAADIDQIVFHEDPHAKFSRVLTSALASFPGSRKEFVNAMKAWLGKKLWSIGTISARLDVDPKKISYLSHHFSHGVQAFMGSGYSDAGILVVDAVGDWACSALYKGEWIDGKPVVSRVSEIAFPNSLGLVYSAFTAYLGFSPNDSEASTMALAGFGKPIYADKVRAIIAEGEDGTYSVDQDYFHFSKFYSGAVSDKFIKEFGPARQINTKLPHSSLFDGEQTFDAESQRYADVAASIQVVLEERIVQLTEQLRSKVDSENLCYAGGVSLNCVANYKILASGLYKNMYIPPDPGDGGTSVGTALVYAATHSDCAPEVMRYPAYMGAEFSEDETIEMLPFIDPDHSLEYLKRGHEQGPGIKWEHKKFESDEALVAEVAERIAAGQIIGWYQGRAEIGPRALGNRSILIRPDDLELANKLSKAVKDRALFRPYAFSITEKDAHNALDVPADHLRFQRWMQYAVPVKPEVRDKVRAAIHYDGTTRPQVVFPADNPRYHALIEAVGKHTGLEVIVNTSFNPSGYPIVSTPVEALSMYARTAMDALVLNNTIVWKQ